MTLIHRRPEAAGLEAVGEPIVNGNAQPARRLGVRESIRRKFGRDSADGNAPHIAPDHNASDTQTDHTASHTPRRRGVRASLRRIRRVFRRDPAAGSAPDSTLDHTTPHTAPDHDGSDTPMNRTASHNTAASDTTTDQSDTSGSDHSIASSYASEPGANVYSYGKWRWER